MFFTARTTHCDNSYDVTIATYSLADLYLPKMNYSRKRRPALVTTRDVKRRL